MFAQKIKLAAPLLILGIQSAIVWSRVDGYRADDKKRKKLDGRWKLMKKA